MRYEDDSILAPWFPGAWLLPELWLLSLLGDSIRRPHAILGSFKLGRPTMLAHWAPPGQVAVKCALRRLRIAFGGVLTCAERISALTCSIHRTDFRLFSTAVEQESSAVFATLPCLANKIGKAQAKLAWNTDPHTHRC